MIASSADLPSLVPDEGMKHLGSLPPIYQPGKTWLYDTEFSVSIEKLEPVPLDENPAVTTRRHRDADQP